MPADKIRASLSFPEQAFLFLKAMGRYVKGTTDSRMLGM